MENLVEGFPEAMTEAELSEMPTPPFVPYTNPDIGWFQDNFDKFVFRPERILAEAVPYTHLGAGPNFAGIYFLIKDGKIVYIGKASAGVGWRLRAHFLSEKKWTHYWAFSGIPEKFIESVENFYIAWLRPHLNSWRISYNQKILDKYGGATCEFSRPEEERIVYGPRRLPKA